MAGLEIFVFILGDSLASKNMFSVVAPASMSVGVWRHSVYAKRQNGLKGYDAADLVLWKLRQAIPVTDVDRTMGDLGQDLLSVGDKMLPAHDLSDYFPVPPPRKSLHVIAVLPSYKTPENHPGSLPKLTRTWAPPDVTTVQASIDAFVEDKLRPEIQGYLEAPRVSHWSPPEAVTQETRNFYTNLEVPLVNGKPSLLLHRLRESPNPNGDLLFDGRPHLIYCAVSGSGKTRVVFEGFCKFFGFYFVAARGTDGMGSRDLEAMISIMCDHHGWVQEIFKNRAPDEVLRANTFNESIATRAILKVILARWVIFKAFIETARVHNGGTLSPDIKQDWLLFQALPSVLIHQMDPFSVFIDTCLYGADIETLRSLRAKLNLEQILGSEFKNDKLFYVLDEVQVLGEQYFGCFSDASGKIQRPVLCPIIRTLTLDSVDPVIVSGTGFSLDNFKVVLSSGVAKDPGWETDYSTGDFTNPETQTSYIERYLPPAFLCSPSGRTLLDRMYRWLRGRHRFTARFIEALLTGAWHETGPAAPHKQLNTYIHRLSGCTPHDGDNVFVGLEPDVKVIRVDTFMWERIDANTDLLKELAFSFHTWITQGNFPLWWKEQQSLVEYGLARFIWIKELAVAEASKDRLAAVIQEPLALAGIMNHWHSRKIPLLDNIWTRFQSNQGTAFEEVLVFVMTKMLQNKSALGTIFTFRITPPWARSTAQIMAKTSSGALEIFQDHQLTSTSTETVLRAENLDEVKYWLQHGPAAWCIPPKAMGPALMAWVVLNNGKALLLVIQAKCWFTGNIATLASDVSAHAIRSTIPANFFVSSINNNEDRQQLTAMLETINPQSERYTTGRYNILRVVAAFPLDVNFDSSSADVQTALAEDVHALARLSNTALVSTLADYPEGPSIISMLATAVKKARKLGGDGDGGSRSPSKKRKLGEQGGENSMAPA